MDLKPGIYEHYKKKLYKVHFVARHSETLEYFVCYECLHDNPRSKYWVRPLEMFTENVEVDGEVIPRFKYLRSK